MTAGEPLDPIKGLSIGLHRELLMPRGKLEAQVSAETKLELPLRELHRFTFFIRQGELDDEASQHSWLGLGTPTHTTGGGGGLVGGDDLQATAIYYVTNSFIGTQKSAVDGIQTHHDESQFVQTL